MNIILKGFDDGSGKPIVESALKGMKIGTCISILNDKKQWPEIDTKEHIWMSAKLLRAGQYPDVDWSKITPLDEEVIQNMRNTESVFLTMVERYAKYADMPYAERLRQYTEHLRYWNHILETKDIGLLLMNTAPHQCYDLVMYDLCKKKNIPVLYLERLVHFGTCTLEDDWERAGEEIRERYEVLEKEHAGDLPVTLSDSFERFYKMYSEVDRGPWYMGPRSKHLEHKTFVQKWGAIAVRILVHKPRYFFRSVLNPLFWKRKWHQHYTTLLYDRFTQDPPTTEPFIYVPLHMQPEATTCPLGGVFTDQQLMVQMLAHAIPAGVHLVIKEHPAQGEMCRSAAFYEALKAIPSVILVPRHYDTFRLTKDAIAVATVTGTAMLEGLFREKPAIMFGHQYFQYAPGVFRVHTREDCAGAVRMILEKKKTHTAREMKLFVKAIQDCSCPYAGSPEDPHISLTKDEKAVLMGEAIAARLKKIWP